MACGRVNDYACSSPNAKVVALLQIVAFGCLEEGLDLGFIND